MGLQCVNINPGKKKDSIIKEETMTGDKVYEDMTFDEGTKLFTYKVSSVGFAAYGYGKTKEAAKINFNKNLNEMWER